MEKSTSWLRRPTFHGAVALLLLAALTARLRIAAPEAHSYAGTSLEELLRIARQRPNDPPVQLALGERAAALGQDRLAVAVLGHAARLDPENETAWIAWANATHFTDPTGASQASILQEFLRHRPGSARATAALSALPRLPIPSSDGTHAASDSAVVRAQRVSLPAAPLVRLLQDADALAVRQPVGAEHAYRRILVQYPQSGQAHEALGLLLSQERRNQEALFEYQEAVRLDPYRAAAQFALGNLYRDAGFFQMARQHFEAATRAQPQTAEYWAALGQCCGTDLGYLNGQDEAYHEAEKALTRALALQPANSRYLLDLADMQVQTDRLAEAEANYRHALARSPEDNDARLRLSRFLLTRRSVPSAFQEAEGLLERVQATEPQNRFAQFYLGQAALERGQTALAATYLEKVVAHRPDADAWYLLSRAYRKSGRSRQSDAALAKGERIRHDARELRRLEDWTRIHPRDLAAQWRLARLNVQREDYARALNVYRMCLAIAPGDAILRREAEGLATRLRRSGHLPDQGLFEALVSALPPVTR